MTIRYLALLILFCISSVACSSEQTVRILLDIQNGTQIIYIDGVVTEKEELYTELMTPLNTKGREAEVNVLFNPSLSFSEVINMRGIIQAVGFANIRYYYLSDDKRKMAQIELGKSAVLVPAGLIE